MRLSNLLFSLSGRLNRLPFWLAGISVAVIFTMLVFLSLGLGGLTPGTFNVIFVLYVPVVWIAIALGVKRLHDRDKQGWWLLLFYVAPSILHTIAERSGPAGLILLVIALILNVWALIELGFLRGTRGLTVTVPIPWARPPDCCIGRSWPPIPSPLPAIFCAARSVTPDEGGALALLERLLEARGLCGRARDLLASPARPTSRTSTPASATAAPHLCSPATPTWCRPATKRPGRIRPSPARSPTACSMAAAPST